MATLTERVAALEGEFATILASIKQAELGMQAIRRALPSMRPEDVQAITELVAIVRDIRANGLRVPSLAVVNEAGNVAVALNTDETGAGIVSVCAPDGSAVAGLSVATDGSGVMSVLDADRQPLAALHIQRGAGRLDLAKADGQALHSFGPRD